MAAEDITVQQNTSSGPGQDLPQGAASAVNDLLPTETVAAPDEMAPAPEAGGSAVDAFPDGTSTAGAADYQPRGLEEEMLFLDPEVTPGATPVTLPAGRLPDSVVRMLPYMRAAGAEPGAPESLRAIYAAAVNALDAGLR